MAEFVCIFCDYPSDGPSAECPQCGRRLCFARAKTWRRLQKAAAVTWLAIGAFLTWVVAWSLWPGANGSNFPDAWWVLPLLGSLAAPFLSGGIAGLLGRPRLYRSLGGWFAGRQHGGASAPVLDVARRPRGFSARGLPWESAGRPIPTLSHAMTVPISQVWFENPPMGQRARLVTLPHETAGRSNQPFTGQFAVPPHLHPTYRETFEILAGNARYRVGSEERTAGPGDRLVLPAGISHVHPWSDSAEELHVRQTAEADPPDLRGLTASLQGAITIFGLAGAGRVNRKGVPNLLQVAVIIHTTMPATYLTGPPILLQRLLFSGLAGLGRLFGYRSAYAAFGLLTPRGLERAAPTT